MALGVVRNFAVASALGPESYGMWVIVMLVLTYGDQLHLGLRHAGDREIPYWRSAAGESEATHVANVLYGGTIVVTLIALVFIVLGATLAQVEVSPQVLAMLTVVLLADQVGKFHFMIFRASKEFILSSKLEVLFEAIRTAAIAVLAVFWKFEGALGGVLIASVAPAVVLSWRHRRRLVPKFEAEYLRRLWSVGFSLFISGLLYVLILNMDRLIGSLSLSKADLGLYGMAAVLAQLPLSITQSVSTVLFPTMSEHYGKGNDARNLRELFLRSMTAMTFLAPVVAVGFFFAAEVLVGIFLPEFQSSISLVAILSMGMCFLGLSPVPMGILMSSGNNRLLIRKEIITLAVFLVAYALVLLRWRTADSIAAATAIGFTVFSFLSFSGACAVIGLKRSESFHVMRLKYIPASATALLLFFFSRIGPSTPSSVPLLFLHVSIQCLLAGVVLSGLALALNKRLGLIELARQWRAHA